MESTAQNLRQTRSERNDLTGARPALHGVHGQCQLSVCQAFLCGGCFRHDRVAACKLTGSDRTHVHAFRRIGVDGADTHSFTCNAITFGSAIVVHRASCKRKQLFDDTGSSVIGTSLDRFQCLTLRSDTRRIPSIESIREYRVGACGHPVHKSTCPTSRADGIR